MKVTPQKFDPDNPKIHAEPVCCNECKSLFCTPSIARFAFHGARCPYCDSTNVKWLSWDQVEILPKRPRYRIGKTKWSFWGKRPSVAALPLGGGTQTISGSNQMDSEPRRFKLSLYDDQFVVLYLVGDQLLMHSSYHAGFIR